MNNTQPLDDALVKLEKNLPEDALRLIKLGIDLITTQQQLSRCMKNNFEYYKNTNLISYFVKNDIIDIDDMAKNIIDALHKKLNQESNENKK